MESLAQIVRRLAMACREPSSQRVCPTVASRMCRLGRVCCLEPLCCGSRRGGPVLVLLGGEGVAEPEGTKEWALRIRSATRGDLAVGHTEGSRTIRRGRSGQTCTPSQPAGLARSFASVGAGLGCPVLARSPCVGAAFGFGRGVAPGAREEDGPPIPQSMHEEGRELVARCCRRKAGERPSALEAPLRARAAPGPKLALRVSAVGRRRGAARELVALYLTSACHKVRLLCSWGGVLSFTHLAPPLTLSLLLARGLSLVLWVGRRERPSLRLGPSRFWRTEGELAEALFRGQC